MITSKSTWSAIYSTPDVPKLSSPSKMPCHSMSIPAQAQACKVGAILAKLYGTVCFNCYALKGMYVLPTVKALREHNLRLIETDLEQWEHNSIILIGKSSSKGGYFRWFASGDLQSFKHLLAIIRIALALPKIKFWLPTKEKALLNELLRQKIAIPDNLIIRLSMTHVNVPASNENFLTSTVYTHDKKPLGQACIAPSQEGKCLACRACWNKSIPTISYPEH